MSLITKIGGIFTYLSVVYLFAVPVINPASPHAYVPEFILLGVGGIYYVYHGWNMKPTKSP